MISCVFFQSLSDLVLDILVLYTMQDRARMIRCYSVLVLVIAALSLVVQVVLAVENEDDNFLSEPEARNAVAKG